MTNRVKYPLTEEAKVAARKIVDDWKSGSLKQVFQLLDTGDMLFTFQGDDSPDWQSPPIGLLRELAQYGLISMRIDVREEYSTRWEIVLLQELRNAVQDDFAVSDFFLTTAAVGTIINMGENAGVTFNAPFQSAASTSGNIYQTVGQLADNLTETLGESLLESNAEIKTAIVELGKSDESNRVIRVGSVIEVLGRYMAHAGSAASVIAGVQMLAQYLH